MVLPATHASLIFDPVQICSSSQITEAPPYQRNSPSHRMETVFLAPAYAIHITILRCVPELFIREA